MSGFACLHGPESKCLHLEPDARAHTCICASKAKPSPEGLGNQKCCLQTRKEQQDDSPDDSPDGQEEGEEEEEEAEEDDEA